MQLSHMTHAPVLSFEHPGKLLEEILMAAKSAVKADTLLAQDTF
jgi:hypothetical protein